jgi:hypothetical protein
MEPWEDAAAERRWRANGCPPMRVLLDEMVRRHGVDGAVRRCRRLGVSNAGDLLTLAVEAAKVGL